MASSPVIIQVATPGPAGPAGPGGATGPPGYSPRYYVQPGVPTSGVGLAADMYINSTTSDVWGPKIDNTTWPATPACNIRGIAGYSPVYIVAAGAPGGATGNVGDMYINSTTADLYGPKSAGGWGGIVANLKGPAGATGAQGPPGVAYTPRGAWSSASVAYLLGDEVSDAGQVWISLVNHTSSAGNRPSTPTPATWQSVGSGGMADPTTTKGDLIVRGSAAPATRLPVGSNGQILIADSTQTLGVKWGADITQTPWTSDINAAGFKLNSVAAIGVGAAASTMPLKIEGGSITTLISTVLLNAVYNNAACGQSIDWSANSSGHKEMRVAGCLNAAGTAGELSFYTNLNVTAAEGTEKVRITGSGNLGVATTSPVLRLEVQGATYAAPATSGAAASGSVRIAATGHGESLDIGIAPNSVWLQARSSVDYSTNYNLLLLPNGGKVGIGNTTAPADFLTLVPVAFVGNADGGIRLQTPANEWYFRMAIKSDAGGASRLAFDVAATEMLAVNPFGLGVGRIPTTYKLEVAGDCNITGTYRVNGTPISSSSDGTVYIAYATTFLTLTTSRQDVPGATLTLARAGRYLITGIFKMSRSAGTLDANVFLFGSLVAGGTLQTQEAVFGFTESGDIIGGVGTVAQQWVYVAAANAVAKLQAYKNGGTGSSAVDFQNGHTSICAVWIAAS